MPPLSTNRDGIQPRRRACAKCGLLGHLIRTCTAPEKAHLKIGIEIEGYWNAASWSDVQRNADNWHMSGDRDGSLNGHAGYQSYELRTRPGSLGEAVNQLVALYPDATDEQVGMHVHVSFERSDVPFLASTAFFEYFRASWKQWGESMSINPDSNFWKRLNGHNQYCRLNSVGDSPRDNVTRMDRYRQLNFSSLDRHHTVECRLLPMFQSARLGVSAVERLINIYESWLTGGLVNEHLSSAFGRDVEITPADGPRKLVTTGACSLPNERHQSPVSVVGAVNLYPSAPPAPGHVRVMSRRLANHLQSRLDPAGIYL